MTWLQFGTETVKAVVWPIVVVWLAHVFRPELAGLLRNLTLAKIFGGEFHFDEKVKGITRETARVLPEFSASKPASTGRTAQSARARGERPASVVLGAWDRIEEVLVQLADFVQLGPKHGRSREPDELISHLAQRGYIESDVTPILMDLYDLRNGVAYTPGYEPSRDNALEYFDNANKVIHSLETSLMRQQENASRD